MEHCTCNAFIGVGAVYVRHDTLIWSKKRQNNAYFFGYGCIARYMNVSLLWCYFWLFKINNMLANNTTPCIFYRIYIVNIINEKTGGHLKKITFALCVSDLKLHKQKNVIGFWHVK